MSQRLSLLSLSIAAANAPPLSSQENTARASQGTTTTKHRRLSSAGRSRRRLSDARDAATRPFPTSLQTASASLAALSLSSPTVAHRSVNGPQPVQVARTTARSDETEFGSADDHLSTSPPQSHTPVGTRSSRKRGTIFTCESCSKVYRHPSCLIKHRWEHTPQWREASKFVLSKHQQVQLLEAAAILSHLSPSSASLPEDRSLWPSFLSGGLVPPPAPNQDASTAPPSNTKPHHPISSSVPASTDLSTRPLPTGTDDALNLLALRSGGTGTGTGTGTARRRIPFHHARAHSYSVSSSSSTAYVSRARRQSNAYEYGHTGWSLPRSSVRSKSGSRSRSLSVSESRSDDERAEDEAEGEGEEEDVDVRVGGGLEDEMEEEEDVFELGRGMFGRLREEVYAKKNAASGKAVEHVWDGMEMEMEMA